MPIGLITAGVGAAGAIGGALISSNAAGNAANIAQQTAAQDNALQLQIYNENKGLVQPYADRGNAAGNELSGFLGLGGDPAASQAALNTYLNSTGYQFQKNEGMNAVTGDKAASGLLNSGSTLKALNQFGTGLADQYGQQYVGNLENLNASGQAAVGSLVSAGQNYANQANSNSNNAASITANAGLTSAGQINGLIGNAFKAYGSFAGGGNAFGQSSFGGGNLNAAGATPPGSF